MGIFEGSFNKLAAWWTAGEYCHSEFIFTWDTETRERFFSTIEGHERLKSRYKDYEEDGKIHICFYVLWGDTTSYRLLKYQHNNPFYRMPIDTQFTTLSVPMEETDEFKMATFLLNQCKKKYDYAGALTYYIPLRYSNSEYPTYFCSQLMVCALQHVRHYQEINPSSVTPNKLYTLLSN